MGVQKGVVVLLFFLFIIITMAGFIDLPNLFTRANIEVIDDSGKSASIEVSTLEENVVRDNEVVYKKISVSFIQRPLQKLQIEVENDWLQYYQIETDEIKVRKIESGNAINLSSSNTPYATSTVVEISPAENGVYEVYVPKKTLLKTPEIKSSTQWFIASCIIAVLLIVFVLYHFRGKHNDASARKDKALGAMSAQVKKMMLDGRHDDQIRQALRKQGISEADIDQVLRRARFF